MMFHPVVRVLIKLLELFGCVACVVTKVLTDQESRRVFLRNQKFSREWSLLNNVTWSREGNAFANITYGGFTLITTLLLLSRCINLRERPSITEKVFLTVGMLFFFAMGGLVFAALEHVPEDLQDNAIILGCLSFFVAFMFLIDLADPLARHRSNQTQTENVANVQTATQTSSNTPREFKELNIPNQRVDLTPLPSPDVDTVPPNGHYFPGDQVDIVQMKTLPTPQEPIFAKILMPEKRRPMKNLIGEPSFVQRQPQSLKTPSPSRERAYGLDVRSRADVIRKEYTSDEENVDRPIRSGFVAQAARMWDKRARRSGPELSTIV